MSGRVVLVMSAPSPDGVDGDDLFILNGSLTSFVETNCIHHTLHLL